MKHSEKRLFLINELMRENGMYRTVEIPSSSDGQKRLLRSLMNIRPPKPVSDSFLSVQDEYLQEEMSKKKIVTLEELTPVKKGIYLWQGDITTLRADAIVNAANSKLLGCFVPCHGCIDNAIHSAAGIQLRLACDELMSEQGYDEPAGTAKITPAYNLPSGYVIHTVGPIVYGRLTEKHCRQLEDCYKACLELAADNGLKSVAFCCISTGEFHFPQKKAAEIAVHTVSEFMKSDSRIEKVIFNVFKQEDYEIYKGLLA